MGYLNGLKLVVEKYHYRFKHNGQLLRGSTGCSTLPDAQKWLTRYRAKLAFEGVGIREMPTLRQLLVEWAETAGATNKPDQIKAMKAALHTHCKHLLALTLDQITTERVQATLLLYLTSKGCGPGRQGHTKGGANALRLRLNTLMGYAIRCGYLTKKPYEVKKFKTQRSPRPVVRAAKTKDYLDALERLARSEDRKLAVVLMLGLGLRESEALGLRWEFIDLEHGSLTVGRLEDGAFTTKGGEARRIKVLSWVIERLRKRWEADKKPKHGLVLPGPKDEVTGEVLPHSPGYTRPLVKRVGAAVGLLGLTPHRLRASFVTSLVLEAGVPLPQAQRMVGHKHITTTMGYIAEIEDHGDAMADLERLQGIANTLIATPCR